MRKFFSDSILIFCVREKDENQKIMPLLIFVFAIFGYKMQCYIIIFSWILSGLIRPQDEQKDYSSLFPPEVISDDIVIFFHFINLNMARIKCIAVYLLLMWGNVTRSSKKKIWVLIHIKIPYNSVWYSCLSVRNPEKCCIITLSEGLTRSQTINYSPAFITPKRRLD